MIEKEFGVGIVGHATSLARHFDNCPNATTVAAVGFAGLLVVIMRSEEVRAILTDLIQRALTFAG
ncbi:MAG: DUF4244 domain-containing protein [Homoserinimonas sp.]